MIILNTKFDSVKVFTPKVYYDDRGFFLESFNKLIDSTINATFVQDNHSKSKKHIVRGLHYQWDEPMGKLARVIKGRGIDIIVDIRKDSPTYGQYDKVELSEDNFNIVWVPPGFAHGFLSLDDDTHLIYKTTAYYNQTADDSINPLCSTLNIDWGIPIHDIILSAKDSEAQSFDQYKLEPKF
jgi:dTDP-4-dehydrorhamnose 3,5-epimerase